VQAGFLPPFEAYTDKLESIRQFTNQPTSEGVCAVVKIQLTQRFVLTRNAFKATLEIDNGSGATLSKINVTLFITNTIGSIRTSSFSILPPELENLNSVNGNGVLVTQTTGTATWIIVPGRNAAPSKKKIINKNLT
jgi:hypothetical protein